MKYSVVIPLFNEAENLIPLYQQLRPVMDGLKDSYELIFVNDGSKDKSLNILQKLQSQDKAIQIINLQTRLGQTTGLQAGFNSAHGEIVISLDADLQNDPADIPLLLKRLNQGYDLVCGWRRRRHDRLLKRIFSRIGNTLQRLFLRAPVHDIACTLRVYRRVYLKELNLKTSGEHTIIPCILHRKGYKVSELPVHHRPRISGRTKYNLLKQIAQSINVFLKSFTR